MQENATPAKVQRIQERSSWPSAGGCVFLCPRFTSAGMSTFVYILSASSRLQSRALSCHKTRIGLASSALRWRILSRFALASMPFYVHTFSHFNLCSTVVRAGSLGRFLAASSPLSRDLSAFIFCSVRLLFVVADFVCFKGAFLFVRSLFDRASASPPAAWSQATVSGSAGGTERAYRPASAR